MGGTPALGGMVLPKLQQKQLTSLSSTESPAARELQIAQGKAEPPSLTSPQPSLETPSNSPPWLVSFTFLASTLCCNHVALECHISG